MTRFAQPEFLLLFILLIPAAALIWRWGPRKRARLSYPLGDWVDARPRFTLPSPFRLSFITRILALSLMILGLARPQDIHTRTTREVDAVDMIICFDLSKSMDAVDFSPDRRTVAVQTINQFIDRRVDDRIGLVLFSGEAYLAIPPTSDHKVLKTAVEKSSNRLLQDGTAIGQALALAARHLKTSKAKSRVILLVTDGDNNMGSVAPVTAADLAASYGLKIYAIGIGKKGRVKFPIKQWNPDTRREEIVGEQWLTDAANDELLADIAKRTGGQYFPATDDSLMSQIFSTIDKLERSKVQTHTFTRYTEAGWPLLIMAFLLLVFEGIALNTRWRKLP